MDYAEKKGLALIEDAEVLQLDRAVNEALRIDIEDVEEFSKQFFKTKPLFWIESDTEGEDLIEGLKDSKLYNTF
jgi:hypothetical protein